VDVHVTGRQEFRLLLCHGFRRPDQQKGHPPSQEKVTQIAHRLPVIGLAVTFLAGKRETRFVA
jgi:hypothetical protein